MFVCSLPDNIGDKKYCTPWKQKVRLMTFKITLRMEKKKR